MLEKILYSNITLGKLAEIIGATLPDDIDAGQRIPRILTQSVYTQPGEVVISAGWYPKYDTVKEALEKGAAAVFCDHATKAKFPQSNVIGVDDPMECVYRYEVWRATPCTAKRIAITGSVGKTTTTGLINSVIANSFKTYTHHSMSNSHGAVLRHVQVLDGSYEYWVQEIGGVQPGYVESTARFLCPDIVVLTNIGESHLNLYGTKENILWDKGSLERYSPAGGVVVINSDDALLSNAKFSHQVITCSMKDPNADYYACDIVTEPDGLRFTVKCAQGSYPVHLNLYGDYNAYNAMFAFAVGCHAGVLPERIAQLLETYHPDGMRQNLMQIGGYSLFVDTFNAEPKTVLGSAQTLTQMKVSGNGRKIFVTGHIDKLGTDSAKMHEALGRELAKLELDQILLFAGDSDKTYKGLVDGGFTNAILMNSREDLDNWLRENVTRDDIVFFKSGQFAAGLAKTVDHVFGTKLQNEQQFNNGRVVEHNGYKLRLRMDNIAEIEGYTGKETELVLPGTYEDYTVERIAPFAFTKHRNITSVTIPDSVTNIGQEAFYICPKLAQVKLPARLKIIEKNAFNCCKALKTLEIPHGTIHIDNRAFFDCISLTHVTVPETVGYFGDKVFNADNPPAQKAVFQCVQGSYAAKYAQENGHPVEYVKSEGNEMNKGLSKLLARVRPPKNNPFMTDKEQRDFEAKSEYIFNLVKRELETEPEELTEEELQLYKDTWGELYEYGIAKPKWAGLYKAKTGKFSPDHIGHDLHLYCTEAKLVDTTYIRGLCDKNIMPLVLPTGKHPVTLVRKMNNIYLDRDFNHIDEEEAVSILMEHRRKGAVIKLCRSSGGKGVTFVSQDTEPEQVRSALRESPYITVQQVVTQHPDMAKMNPSSVNTVRIMTILLNGTAQVLSAVVRIGKAGSRVDNFHSGGMSCGIKEDGTLKEFATFVNGDRASVHGSGFVFAEGKIPNFDRIRAEACRLHYCLPVFGLISWDFCIDEVGDPVLIEYNIGGSITLHQTSNGPVYGKYREQILKTVFPALKEKHDCPDFSYTDDDASVVIVKGDANLHSVSIPAEINGTTVTAVAQKAFFNHEKLKSVTISAPLKEIGYMAFCLCKALEQVVFEQPVDRIGRSAFNECTSLTRIAFPDGTKIIGKLALAGCPNLKEVSIPASVTEISPDAFYHSGNVVICCKKGSYAEQFAKQHSLKYTEA